VTTFLAIESLLGRFNVLAGIPDAGTPGAATFVAAAALGTLANTATVIMTVERHLSRRESAESPSTPLFLSICPGLTGFAICLAAVWSVASGHVMIAMAFGLSVMLFIAIARRFASNLWSSGILFAIFATIAAAVIIARFQGNSAVGILGFATSASAEILALVQRALFDSRWLGSGAGTFKSLAVIYQDFGTPPISVAPSTAISIAIEWGYPALVIFSLFTLQLFAFTFRAALRRGRDSFFPSLAAASAAVVYSEAFCDPSLIYSPVQIIIAVMVGMGLSQSSGRTSSL
jgi:hypothetical protein